MIFKPIEPLDYPKLKHFFERQPYNLSIYSLLSIIVWSNCLFKTYYADLPPNLVPHLKLGIFHFMFFNVARLLVLADGYSMSYAA